MTISPQGSRAPSKLFVSNLSQASTLASLRTLFGTCGDVLDVEFAAERGSRSPASAAYVTMATPVAADRAFKELQGRVIGDRVLMLSRVSGDTDHRPERSTGGGRRPVTSDVQVAMTQQYRDRHGLTYELSCAGKLLTLRFIFPIDDAHGWQVEARTLPGSSSAVTASAMTREQAFRALVVAWGTAFAPPVASELDWEGVATALRAVRAL